MEIELEDSGLIQVIEENWGWMIEMVMKEYLCNCVMGFCVVSIGNAGDEWKKIDESKTLDVVAVWLCRICDS